MPDSLTPSQRTLRARIAAHASWANTEDVDARTKPGRDAAWQRFLDQVDPDRTLPTAERERRARHARTAHMQRLAYLSAKSRRSGGEAA